MSCGTITGAVSAGVAALANLALLVYNIIWGYVLGLCE